MKKRIITLLAILAVMVACIAFSAQAAVTPNSDTYTGTTACPCSSCNGNAYSGEWESLSGTVSTSLTGGKHYIVEAGNTLSFSGTVTLNNTNTVILVAGTIDTSAGHLRVGNSSKTSLWLLGGGGVWQGAKTAGNHYNPCAIGVYSNGTLNIIGNMTFGSADDAETSALLSGRINVVNGGTVNMYGGTVYGFNFTSGNTTSHSAVYIRVGTFNLYGGTIYGGSSKYGAIDMSYTSSTTAKFYMYGGEVVAGDDCTQGGAIYLKEGQVYLYGGTVRASTDATGLTHGGAIYADGSTKTVSVTIGSTDESITTTPTIYGGSTKVTTSNGVSTYSGCGGAIYASGGATVTINKGTIYGNTQAGAEPKYGGAVYVTGATVNMTGGTIDGGTAWRGGCIYATGESTVNISGTAEIKNGAVEMLGGETAAYGGAIFASNATINMSGGTVTAKANDLEGHADGIRLQSATMNMSGGRVVSSNNGVGSGIDAVDADSATAPSTLFMSGNATVLGPNGETVNNIVIRYNKTKSILNILNTWSGEASVAFPAVTIKPGSAFSGYGEVLKLSSGAYVNAGYDEPDGIMHTEAANVDNPALYGASTYGYMPMRCVGYGTTTSGAEFSKWYITPARAMTDANTRKLTDAYVQLRVNYDVEMPKNLTAVVDMNGYKISTLTHSGSSKLYVFDSKATTYDSVSAGTVPAGAQPVYVAPNGITYIVVNKNVYPVNVTSANLTGVTLRPSAAGMYFSAESVVEAHPTAQAAICTGVAVSLDPITTLEGTAWTATEGSTGNGILVQNILKDELDTAAAVARAGQPVYAEACVTYGGELLYLANEGRTDLCLTTLVEKLAGAYGTLAGQQKYFYDFVDKWQTAYEGLWSTVNLQEPTTEA